MKSKLFCRKQTSSVFIAYQNTNTILKLRIVSPLCEIIITVGSLALLHVVLCSVLYFELFSYSLFGSWYFLLIYFSTNKCYIVKPTLGVFYFTAMYYLVLYFTFYLFIFPFSSEFLSLINYLKIVIVVIIKSVSDNGNTWMSCGSLYIFLFLFSWHSAFYSLI
jgi:hypothetical protein